jgi:hypothetical protein
MPPKPTEPNNERPRGWTDKHGAAAYTGYSEWQFLELAKAGVFEPPTYLTPGSKGMWSYRGLDASYEKAKRSRKPRRQLRGIVRQRLEAKQRLKRADTKAS